MTQPQEDLQIVMKAGDILKKSDFTDAFKKVLEIVLQIKQETSQAVSKMEQTYSVMMDKMNSNHDASIADMKSSIMDTVDKQMKKMMAEYEAKMYAMDEKMDSLKDGEPGKDGATGPAGKDFPIETYHKLNADIESIKTDVQKAYEEARKPKAIGGMKKITSVRSINLSSQLNGTLKAFTLPKDTLKVLGVWGTEFPISFNQDVDWTFSGTTLTLTSAVSAPAQNQTLFCLVETAFYAKS